jgi:hypothetical protein
VDALLDGAFFRVHLADITAKRACAVHRRTLDTTLATPRFRTRLLARCLEPGLTKAVVFISGDHAIRPSASRSPRGRGSRCQRS